MFAVIDCGTTNTRLFLVDEHEQIVASGEEKVGVRDTSITGSRAKLKHGVEGLFARVLEQQGLKPADIRFAIASGMITSEIGLIEIPHLVAPCGLKELSENIEIVTDPNVVDLGVPVYFIRGIRNNYGDATIRDLRRMDFLRGEEVQCVGILNKLKPGLPLNVVVFSSHTKFVHIDEQQRITHCLTTMSGQIYEALKTSTNVGKSIERHPGEGEGHYSYEEIVDTACECVEHAGIVRTLLMPRFMEVLLDTTGAERDLFADAAIAYDDMNAYEEFIAQGNAADDYVLFGHQSRCEMFQYLLRKRGHNIRNIISVYDKAEISALTVDGVITTAAYIIGENA